MIKPRIIVTGASGKTGSVVAAQLLEAGYPVRALVHREDGRSTQLKAQGAEIAVADLSDVERVADALNDVQRAYFCPPYDPYMIQGAVAFAVAARAARLDHIVGLSQWLASPSHPSLATRQSWLVDRSFSMIPGVAHTIVNPGFFADSYLVTIGLAAHFGIFPWMYGNSRNAPPSNEDIARVAVAALIDPARHAGKSYRPTGPELLGAEDMAKAIARAVGRPVRVVPTPTWLFMKTARMAGMPIELMSKRSLLHRGSQARRLRAGRTNQRRARCNRARARELRDNRSSLCRAAAQPADVWQLAPPTGGVPDRCARPGFRF